MYTDPFIRPVAVEKTYCLWTCSTCNWSRSRCSTLPSLVGVHDLFFPNREHHNLQNTLCLKYWNEPIILNCVRSHDFYQFIRPMANLVPWCAGETKCARTTYLGYLRGVLVYKSSFILMDLSSAVWRSDTTIQKSWNPPMQSFENTYMYTNEQHVLNAKIASKEAKLLSSKLWKEMGPRHVLNAETC